MQAVVLRGGRLAVESVRDPEPGDGEVLVRTLACGICGSDLHAVKHGPTLKEVWSELGISGDPTEAMVLGHEFCAEILDHGPGTTRRLAAGTAVCGVPFLPRADGLEFIGYSNRVPGGYGELMVLREELLLPVPEGLAPRLAALTEPVAVGVHAVNLGRLTSRDVPLVVGCGPVGLAVIAALRLRGAAPIVAADFSPARRALAERLGADVVVDPATTSPYASWLEAAVARTPEEAMPPSLVAPGAPPLRPAVIFECVGVPGIVDQIVRGAPPQARVVVVGVCMERDSFQPLYAIGKEIQVQFAFCYTPEEYAHTLAAIGAGRLDPEPLVTGRVDLAGVPGAFAELATPERHAKILVEPDRA